MTRTNISPAIKPTTEPTGPVRIPTTATAEQEYATRPLDREAWVQGCAIIQRPVAGRGSGELPIAELATYGVERCSMVGLAVGIDTAGDKRRRVVMLVIAVLLPFAG